MVTKEKKMPSEDLAYAGILKLIYERKFSPGDFLQEEYLSHILGMSRTPINRALSKMNIEGLLERKKKKGCFIPVVTLRDGRKLFTLRAMIEGQVAWEAAQSCTSPLMDRLCEINRQDQKALKDRDDGRYYMANRDFHFLLAESANNRYLERVSKQLFHQASIYIFFYDSFYTSTKKSAIYTPEQHEVILQCIKDRNADAARVAMEEHIIHTMKMFGSVD